MFLLICYSTPRDGPNSDILSKLDSVFHFDSVANLDATSYSYVNLCFDPVNAPVAPVAIGPSRTIGLRSGELSRLLVSLVPPFTLVWEPLAFPVPKCSRSANHRLQWNHLMQLPPDPLDTGTRLTPIHPV